MAAAHEGAACRLRQSTFLGGQRRPSLINRRPSQDLEQVPSSSASSSTLRGTRFRTQWVATPVGVRVPPLARQPDPSIAANSPPHSAPHPEFARDESVTMVVNTGEPMSSNKVRARLPTLGRRSRSRVSQDDLRECVPTDDCSYPLLGVTVSGAGGGK